MRFEIGCVDHDCLFVAVIRGQTHHHLREDAFVAPPFPAIVQRLVEIIFLGRIAPPQAIAINEDNPAQNAPVINARLAVGLREKGSRRAICVSVASDPLYRA